MEKQTKTQTPQILSLAFGVLVICFAIASYALGWTEPTENPPGGNVGAPLNTGPNTQEKQGGLILNRGGISSTGLEVFGNIRLGGASPTYKLTNLILPTEGSDAVNKDYVDARTVDGGGSANPYIVTYGATTCPAGYNKAYDGILVGVFGADALYPTSLMGFSPEGTQANLFIVCMGNELIDYEKIKNYGGRTIYYAFAPLTNYNTYERAVSCAVCMK